MPTYAYECTKCHHHFERVQKITDPPRKRCPKCGGKTVRLILGGGGIILKGPGFYATDYRGGDYHEKAKAETGDAGPGDARGDSEQRGSGKNGPQKGGSEKHGDPKKKGRR